MIESKETLESFLVKHPHIKISIQHNWELESIVCSVHNEFENIKFNRILPIYIEGMSIEYLMVMTINDYLSHFDNITYLRKDR